MRIRFGAFTFDSARCLLARGDSPIHLTRKAFLLLELLLESRPAVVSKGRIMDRLWPSCFVSEGNLANLVSELRGAFGRDDVALIRTVHGVGYAFAGDAIVTNHATALSRFVLIEKGPPPRNLALSDGVTLIGRSVECDARIEARTVSRTHARILLAGDAATIEDLGSRNGTYVCGRRLLGAATLADGDEIRVGSVDLVFRLRAAEQSATAPVE